MKNKYRKKSRKFRTFKNRLIIILLGLAVIFSLGLGALWVLNILFAVREIQSENTVKYEKEQIITASKIKKGDSLWLLNPTKCEMEICRDLTYVDEAKITKIFPNKVKIDIGLSEPQFTVFNGEEYFVISRNDKILERKSEIVPELTNLVGLNFSVLENRKISYEKPELKILAQNILDSFKNVGLPNVESVNLTDVNNIVLEYDNRIKILLGGEENLEYKSLTAHEIIVNKIKANERGTLDLRNLKKDNKSYFISESV